MPMPKYACPIRASVAVPMGRCNSTVRNRLGEVEMTPGRKVGVPLFQPSAPLPHIAPARSAAELKVFTVDSLKMSTPLKLPA